MALGQNQGVRPAAIRSGQLLLTAGLVLAVLVSGAGALEIGRATGATAAWFPAVGVGVLALLVADRRHWGALSVALTVAFALANLLVGRSVLVSVLLGLADTVEVLLVAVLVGRVIGRRMRDVVDVWWLFAIAITGALVGGALIALVYALLLDAGFWRTFGLVVPSHGTAVLLLAPLALLGLRSHDRGWVTSPVELTAQVAALAAATMVTLAPGYLTLGFAPLPVLVWAAVRFSPRIVVAEQIVFAVAVSLLTQLGSGVFSDLSGGPAGSTRYAQLYLACVVLIGVPLAVAMEQRDRALTRLGASERVFRRNFTETRVPIALVTCAPGQAHFAECNAAAVTLLDRPVEQLVGAPAASALESPGLFTALEEMAIGRLTWWSGPVTLPGRPRTRLDATLSLLDHDDQQASCSLHLVDVTETLELQERLQAERDYTRAVIDTASSMIVVTDERGTVIAANPATTAVTGFTEPELVGRPFWELLVAEHQQLETQLLGDAGLLPRTGEVQLQTKDDGPRLVAFSTEPYRASVDAEVTYVLSATDLTAARENAGLVDHLLRSARTIAFVGTDLGGSITLFNTGAEHMLGLPADDAAGRHLVEFIDSTQQRTAAEAFAAIVDTAAGALTPETRELTWLPVGRAPIQVSMTTNPVTDTFGRLIGYLFVATDITDTRRSQEILVTALQREREVVARLRDLDQAKDDFISTVSHELRTPMSSIIGSAEMLGEGMVGDLLPQQQRLVDVIARNGDRLLNLADDLLMLATYEHDGWEAREQIDLRAVVEDSADAAASLLASRELSVSYAMPSGAVRVQGDPSQLERAVTNLLGNAVKFTPDGGSVRVTVVADETLRSARLEVSDTGLGIPEPDLDAVFGRFYRSALVQEQAIQGSGLGLAIVRTIVESHEGSVEVRSTVGVGSTFTVTLPLVGDRAGDRAGDQAGDQAATTGAELSPG